MMPMTACIAEASSAYHVQASAIEAIIAHGLPAGVERDGRIGPMGIPEQWLPVFQMMGIDASSVANDACQNILAGAWIMAYAAAAQSDAGGDYAPQGIYASAKLAERRKAWAPTVRRVAALTGVSAALLDAVITVESRYQPNAVSRAGAIGMMQLMPRTAAMLGGNAWNAEQNILMGARYLAQLGRQFNGDLQLTIAAYNAGPAAVTKYGYRIPPYPETAAYVPRVVSLYAQSAQSM
jgi:soluble lytic murein transglycosylase-like protein